MSSGYCHVLCNVAVLSFILPQTAIAIAPLYEYVSNQYVAYDSQTSMFLYVPFAFDSREVEGRPLEVGHGARVMAEVLPMREQVDPC